MVLIAHSMVLRSLIFSSFLRGLLGSIYRSKLWVGKADKYLGEDMPGLYYQKKYEEIDRTNKKG